MQDRHYFSASGRYGPKVETHSERSQESRHRDVLALTVRPYPLQQLPAQHSLSDTRAAVHMLTSEERFCSTFHCLCACNQCVNVLADSQSEFTGLGQLMN